MKTIDLSPGIIVTVVGTALTKIIGKFDEKYRKISPIYSKFSLEYFVKMGELFAHFDKNILILRKLGTI